MSSATGWDLVASERESFANTVEGLQDQTGHATLCGHWTVHQVAGHLLTFTNMALPKFFLNMAKNRFNFDVMADKLATQFAKEKSLAEIAADLRTNAGKKSAIPGFPPEMTLSDVVIHHQDIRRALDLGTDFQEGVVEAVLEFMTTKKQAKNIFNKVNLEGIQYVATDRDWTFGTGAKVEGPSEALMMAMAGRPVGTDISGPGVEKLES